VTSRVPYHLLQSHGVTSPTPLPTSYEVPWYPFAQWLALVPATAWALTLKGGGAAGAPPRLMCKSMFLFSQILLTSGEYSDYSSPAYGTGGRMNMIVAAPSS
jgi:hypothetical protein